MEAVVPVKGPAKCPTIASIYGISGASGEERKKHLNESILEQAVKKAIKADKSPYLLCGNMHIDPEASPIINAAIETGFLIDVGHAWASETNDNEQGPSKEPENTYHIDGPTPGIEGKGASRIDVILANPVAASAICHFTPR